MVVSDVLLINGSVDAGEKKVEYVNRQEHSVVQTVIVIERPKV